MNNNEDNIDDITQGLSVEQLQQLYYNIVEFDNDSILVYESCCDRPTGISSGKEK